jgi:hypothetical protein
VTNGLHTSATKSGLTALFLLAACAGSAAADTVTLTLNPSYPTGYSFYTYTGTNGSVQSNVPVAPYPVTLNDTAGLLRNVSAYAICFDINNTSNAGTGYTGTLAYNTDTASMEATYLINQLNLAGVYNATTTIKGEISLAIWQVMFPSSTKADGSTMVDDPNAQSLIATAAQAVSSGAWTVADSNLYPTFIPTNTTSQRFGLILPGVAPVTTSQVNYEFSSQQSPTPEPGTVVLLLTGIAAIAFGRRKFAAAATC